MAAPEILLENLILRGVQAKLSSVFNVDSIVQTTATDIMIALDTQISLQRDKTAIAYPFIFFRLDTYDARPEGQSYRPHALLRNPIYSAMNSDSTALNSLPMIPVRYDFSLAYVDPNEYRTLQFLNSWAFASVGQGLNFSVTYDGAQIDIKSELGSTMQMPNKDSSANEINVYSFAGEFSIHGYAVDVKNIKKIPTLQQPIIANVVPGGQ